MSEELNEDISDVGDSQLSTNETSQTQPQLQQYLTNIFGSDDSDDDHKDDSSTKRPQAKNADEESLFGDSDDDEVATKRSRLVKSGARKVNKRNASTLGNYDPNASESEDDIDGASRQPKSTTKPIKLKKRKHSEEPKSTQKSSNKKIPKRTSKSGNLSNSAGTITGNVDGGDEYDSGEEVQRTKEDDDFIDRKDDNADLMEEYNEDQVFDDSPARSSKSAKKKAAQSRANGDSSLPRKAKDALSEALEELKKPKITVISEHDRSHIVEDLMKKMDSAHKLDEALYAKKEPAVNKLKMLSTVQQMLSMKELQESFLKLHILTPLKRWIQPKKNGDLPSLTVRTAVYELLLKLPCQSEDLKWTDPKEDTVGAIVADLRRHKKETVENKRLLKDIMEKWSRPVFQKSTDVRGLGALRTNEDVQQLLKRELERGIVSGGGARDAEDADVLDRAGAARSVGSGVNESTRARTPYSMGFLYAEVPEGQHTTGKVGGLSAAEKKFRKLFNDGKGEGAKKSSTRAYDVSSKGRGNKD